MSQNPDPELEARIQRIATFIRGIKPRQPVTTPVSGVQSPAANQEATAQRIASLINGSGNSRKDSPGDSLDVDLWEVL